MKNVGFVSEHGRFHLPNMDVLVPPGPNKNPWCSDPPMAQAYGYDAHLRGVDAARDAGWFEITGGWD